MGALLPLHYATTTTTGTLCTRPAVRTNNVKRWFSAVPCKKCRWERCRPFVMFSRYNVPIRYTADFPHRLKRLMECLDSFTNVRHCQAVLREADRNNAGTFYSPRLTVLQVYHECETLSRETFSPSWRGSDINRNGRPCLASVVPVDMMNCITNDGHCQRFSSNFFKKLFVAFATTVYSCQAYSPLWPVWSMSAFGSIGPRG